MTRNSLDVFGLSQGDVVSLVGCNGKTTLMNRIVADALAHGMTAALTTTTKIRVMEPTDTLDIFGSLEEFEARAAADRKPSAVVHGPIQHNKYTEPDKALFEAARTSYDLLVCEADGSRALPLKGWKTNEPVIPEQTTVTIGILPLNAWKLPATIETVCHYQEYLDAFVAGIPRSENQHPENPPLADEKVIAYMISSNQGMFKYSKQTRKIFFLNQVHTEEEQQQARELITRLRALRITLPMVYGSARDGVFYHG